MLTEQGSWHDVPPLNGSGRRAAFLDVDETLIATKSMFDFLADWMARHGDDGRAYDAYMEDLRRRVRTGVPREEINRRYYRNFAGVPAQQVWAAGAEWYRDFRDRPDAFMAAGLGAVFKHQAAGEPVVLVSGSFRALLDPLAADLGVNIVVCSEPIVDESGVLTGEISVPVIGSGKGQAVLDVARRLGIPTEHCVAYGDHESDLPMLYASGSAFVIGTDPVLGFHARSQGWGMLPTDTCSRDFTVHRFNQMETS